MDYLILLWYNADNKIMGVCLFQTIPVLNYTKRSNYYGH